MKTTKGGKVMNPTDAYRKELRKKELKRVIYYFHFKFYYYYYLNLGFYLFSIGTVICKIFKNPLSF